MSLKLGDVLIAGAIPAQPGAMTYKGSCLQSALPTSGQIVGDYWKLTDTEAPYSGQCAIWNGTAWDYSSGSINVDGALSTTSSNPVENRVVTNAINGRLSLTGGTMTGTINFNASTATTRSVNNDVIHYCGGTSVASGPYLKFYGVNCTGDKEPYKGDFFLVSSLAGSNKELHGNTSGMLTWDNNDVLTSTSREGIRKVWIGTKAEYDAITTKNEYIEYHITDDNVAGGDYLPLAGGTMTGPISLSADIRNNSIHSAVDTKWIGIFGGTDSKSAGIWLNGKDAGGSSAGGFTLQAANDTVTKTFTGKVDETLTWSNKDVIVSTSNSGVKKVWKGTLAEYNAITTKDNNTLYNITDDNVLLPKITTSGVSFTPTTGITGGVDVQRNYEYSDHYEYNFYLRLGGIPVQTAQIPLGTLSGIQGTNMFSHTPVPVWYEQGQPAGNGLIYNGGSGYNLYVSGNTVSNNTATFFCRIITTK